MLCEEIARPYKYKLLTTVWQRLFKLPFVLKHFYWIQIFVHLAHKSPLCCLKGMFIDCNKYPLFKITYFTLPIVPLRFIHEFIYSLHQNFVALSDHYLQTFRYRWMVTIRSFFAMDDPKVAITNASNWFEPHFIYYIQSLSLFCLSRPVPVDRIDYIFVCKVVKRILN